MLGLAFKHILGRILNSSSLLGCQRLAGLASWDSRTQGGLAQHFHDLQTVSLHVLVTCPTLSTVCVPGELRFPDLRLTEIQKGSFEARLRGHGEPRTWLRLALSARVLEAR
jgi:hypothetical protein